MSTINEHFITITPRLQRILGALEAQRQVDMYGGIGWMGLLDEDEVFDYDVQFKPLVERGLIEDLSATELGSAGRHLCRITPLGRVCNGIGMMLKDPRITTAEELQKYGVLPFKSPNLSPPPATDSEMA